MADPRPTEAEDFLAACLIHAAIRRGASRMELLDLAIRYKRLDVAKVLVRDA